MPLSTLPMLRRQGEDDALKVGLLADHQFAALEDSVRDGDRKLPSSKVRKSIQALFLTHYAIRLSLLVIRRSSGRSA